MLLIVASGTYGGAGMPITLRTYNCAVAELDVSVLKMIFKRLLDMNVQDWV